MSHHRRSWRFLLVGLLGSVLLAALPGQGRAADTFEEIRKALFDAKKAFDEDRADETQNLLKQALGLLKEFEPSERNYIQEAVLWINFKKPDAALKALDKALQKNTKSAEAYYLQAHVYGKLLPGTVDNNQTALNKLKRAFELKKGYTDPVDRQWAVQATYDLWNLLTKEFRDIELTASEFQLLVEREPENAKFWYFLGLAHIRRNSLEEAADALGKGLSLQPSDWQMHIDFASAAHKSLGVKGAIKRYEDLRKLHPTELAVQMGLAELLIEDAQKDEARKLLREIRQNKTLLDVKNLNDVNVISIRLTLAKTFAKAEEYQDAAGQYARVRGGLPPNWSFDNKISLTVDYGKTLVKAGKVDEGIRQMSKCLEDSRRTSDVGQQLKILIELGNAHRLMKRPDNAEMYFREYLRLLRESTVITVKVSEDVKTAESLGDLYLEDHEWRKAADVYIHTLELINDLSAPEREKYPRNGVQYHLAEAWHGAALRSKGEALQGHDAWIKCVSAAQEVVGDKKYSVGARRMLARAYLQMRQPGKVLEYLGPLAEVDFDAATMTLKAQALLAENRLGDALAQIEKAQEKQPADEELMLLRAQVLVRKAEPVKAGELYQKVLTDQKRNFQAWKGLGDVKMLLAKGADNTPRVNYLTEARNHYQEARDLNQNSLDPEVPIALNQAERELALAEAEVRIHADRLRVALYTGGLILAALIPCAFAFYYFRRQWAMRCFQEVCALERDLIGLIRSRVQSRLGGRWERLAEEPFRGRIDFKALRSRAEKEGARDILAVANFGHLVGIIDAGWDILGLNDLCAAEMADPKEVILANLSYVGSCRTCLAHVGKLEELTGRHLASGTTAGGALKTHLSQHLHKQVKTCLQIIRAKFRITAEPRALPVLAPVTPGTV